jgi:hypothetical protein
MRDVKRVSIQDGKKPCAVTPVMSGDFTRAISQLSRFSAGLMKVALL